MLVLCLSLGASMIGCAAAQRPVEFMVPESKDAPYDRVSRELAANGFSPVTGNRESGIIHTKWQDTGYKYGFIQEQPATIVRRFTVVVSRAEGSVRLILRADVKRCVQDGFTVDDTDVRGSCEVMDGLVPSHQAELDRLGAKLRSALSSRG